MYLFVSGSSNGCEHYLDQYSGQYLPLVTVRSGSLVEFGYHLRRPVSDCMKCCPFHIGQNSHAEAIQGNIRLQQHPNVSPCLRFGLYIALVYVITASQSVEYDSPASASSGRWLRKERNSRSSSFMKASISLLPLIPDFKVLERNIRYFSTTALALPLYVGTESNGLKNGSASAADCISSVSCRYWEVCSLMSNTSAKVLGFSKARRVNSMRNESCNPRISLS